LISWITGFIERTGVVGVGLLMILENVLPPIPSELIMPFAGFVASRGDLNLAVVIVAGTVGSLVGAVFWYLLGRKLGLDALRRWSANHGRWLTLSPNDLDNSVEWFRRNGWKAILLGRLVPGVRTLISIPAGLTGMPIGTFVLLTALGTAFWTGLLAVAGYLLAQNYEAVATWINPVSEIVIGILVAIYLYRVITFGSSRS
jgi:membrane protein DedA with SNARE-associated domain